MTKKSTEKISIKITYYMWLNINKCYNIESRKVTYEKSYGTAYKYIAINWVL